MDKSYTKLIITYNDVVRLSEYSQHFTGGLGYFEIYVNYNLGFEQNVNQNLYTGAIKLRDVSILLKDLTQVLSRVESARAYSNTQSSESLIIQYLFEIITDYEDMLFSPKELGDSGSITTSRAYINFSNNGHRNITINHTLNSLSVETNQGVDALNPRSLKEPLTPSYLTAIYSDLLEIMMCTTPKQLIDINVGQNLFEKHEVQL